MSQNCYWIDITPRNCIVLENIEGLKQYCKKKNVVSKKMCKKFRNWAYFQLERLFIERT